MEFPWKILRKFRGNSDGNRNRNRNLNRNQYIFCTMNDDLKKYCGLGFLGYCSEYAKKLKDEPKRARNGDDFISERDYFIFRRWLEDVALSADSQKIGLYIQAVSKKDYRLFDVIECAYEREAKHEKEKKK